ncbi:MerR family transcriptional regulator [Aeribacillus alveayuensis]|jgi:chromosome-anchoring protein RacA|uniref:Chromosome-anchoring protein RacA n=1 Tax=Aeribacillus alveayuensis TaxID=279215 RepID=A0ABT9VNR7_9BACI|nr:chromosome-anchoring protein RacA [Bacillus alveayuensis]
MNTTTAAKKIGVSPKTVQRWVKQLKLPMVRNELGHYIFAEEDIELLKDIHKQIQNGVSMKDLTVNVPMKKEHGNENLKRFSSDDTEKIWSKLQELEFMVNQKADDVVSYQLLQHRQEMEELQKRIEQLEMKIMKSEQQKPKQEENVYVLDEKRKQSPKPPRKSLISSIFFGV